MSFSLCLQMKAISMFYFFSLFIETFILEDAALIASLLLVTENKISMTSAFLACFLGILFGDLGLYFFGICISKVNFLKKVKFIQKFKSNIKEKNDLYTYSIVLSRFIPGTRTATYLGAGFFSYPMVKFTIISIFTVFIWVFIAIFIGNSVISLFFHHWILSLIGAFLFIHILKILIQKFSNYWEIKSILYVGRKYIYFEFWPSLLFYIPVVFYYIFLSIKYKSIFVPFYCNQELINGGLIGESKWDFLNYLNPKQPSTLKSIKINKLIEIDKIINELKTSEITYPFVIKPDVGQRGFGVRIIKTEEELRAYINICQFDIIIQKYSQYNLEAGIFYVRKPSENFGSIFSITDKKFPFIIGDGETKLGHLIFQDKRARLIASLYFSRLKKMLDLIPQKNQVIYLTECGNHCQGAIFLNGNHLISPELKSKIDRISKQIPNFYFGRFDIRYESQELLRQGKNFEIVEVNGAGAEATHIWDRKTKLVEAYKTLFQQWDILFAIGHENYLKNNKISTFNLKLFLKACLKFIFRDKKFIISS